MKTKQALVTCGGTGYRLRKAGMDFSLSKSFIKFNERPMLYWCLLGLYQAGIEKLVIVGDGEEKVNKAEDVLSEFPYSFSRINFYKDEGLGSNGLPYHARHLLDDHFIFECGHSMSEPWHYQLMDLELVNGDEIVLSKFKPNNYAPRPHVKTEGMSIIPINSLSGADKEFSVGSPRLLNKDYIGKLPELDYDLGPIITHYASKGQLRLVQSRLPIEVDVIEEWREALPFYQDYIEKLMVIV